MATAGFSLVAPAQAAAPPHDVETREMLCEKCCELGLRVAQEALNAFSAQLAALPRPQRQEFLGKCTISCGPIAESSLLEYLFCGVPLAHLLALLPTTFEREPRVIITGKIFRHLKLFVEQNEQLLEGVATDSNSLKHIAQEVERGIYNCVIQECQAQGDSIMRSWGDQAFVGRYSARSSVILDHINPESDIVLKYKPDLALSIMKGTIDFKKVGTLRAIDICPEAFRTEAEIIQLRKQQKVKKRVTEMWTCPGCKARKSTYREVQDRSADEPPSIYCKCMVCHMRFKAA